MTEETKLILEKLDKIESRLDSMEEKCAEVYSCTVDIKNNLIDAFEIKSYLRVLQITMNSLESDLRDLKIKVGAYT